ncbi:MAG: DUF4173 domain-containing protein [Oscillospiraceae bacterium]|nr:DUF4173 domain-containing protein [Oscillospiraceae bacterium]
MNNIPNAPENMNGGINKVQNNQPFFPQYTPTYPAVNMPKKKKKEINFGKSDYIFCGIFAAITVCIVFFGLFGGMGIGFTVSSLALVAAMTAYLIKKESVTVFSISSVVLSALSCTVFVLYHDDFLSQAIAFLILIASGVLYAVSLCDKTVADNFSGVLRLLYAAIISPVENFAVPVTTLIRNDKKKNALQILIAFLAAIPVLAVVIPLLVSSDAAFEGLVTKIISSFGMSLLKLICSVLLFMLIFAFAISCKFRLFKTDAKPVDLTKLRVVKSIFSITFLSIISFVYLVYMLSQTAYFFSAFSGILPAGYEFSFSEYARRGFFETEIIAFINLILLTLSLALTVRREDGKLNAAFKSLITFISAFTVLFIATAISKMIMYIGQYGLTRLRLLTSVFMVATAVVIIAFIVRVYVPRLNCMKYAVIISMALFTVLCIAGIDRTVAAYNVDIFLSGKTDTVDVEMLSWLSDSATPYLLKLTDCGNEDVERRAEHAVNGIFHDYGSEWQFYDDSQLHSENKFDSGFTVSKYVATKLLNEQKYTYDFYNSYYNGYRYDDENDDTDNEYAEELPSDEFVWDEDVDSDWLG